ncbi:PP2C family serine/threonine-protein phosphatase [Aquabacterium humicola]|uniref:PP2C family serine/threonine-protein phosphatase n=1 Tax=Aquabacterium humicola TaxID=3237377 RepID=UPI00254349A9|nr:PP2C family serine/threonine-protein phosphatase [Rubrivivax pictus]
MVDDASAWQATGASVCGKSHIDGGLPNQDYFAIERVLEGDAWIAIVSDGAGTAPRAADGSREACRVIAAGLRTFVHSRRGGGPELSGFRDTIEASVDHLRARLAATGFPLSDFHCTFVACLVAGPVGFIARIGDSVALTTRFALVPGSADRHVDFFPDASSVLHEPDRGEYANETHFVTEPDWRDHLRVTPLPAQTDAVVLMTDGAMDVAMTRKKVFRGFLSNLVGRLAVTPGRADRDATVSAWLGDRQTFAITGDDKTLVVLLRNDARNLARLPLFLGEDPPASMPQLAAPLAPGDHASGSEVPSRPAAGALAPVEEAPVGTTDTPLSSVLTLVGAALVLAAALTTAYAIWLHEPGELAAGRTEPQAASAPASAPTVASTGAAPAASGVSGPSSSSVAASHPSPPFGGEAIREAASAPVEPGVRAATAAAPTASVPVAGRHPSAVPRAADAQAIRPDASGRQH